MERRMECSTRLKFALLILVLATISGVVMPYSSNFNDAQGFLQPILAGPQLNLKQARINGGYSGLTSLAPHPMQIVTADAYLGTARAIIPPFGSTILIQNPDTISVAAYRKSKNLLNGNPSAYRSFNTKFESHPEWPWAYEIGDGSLNMQVFFVDNFPYSSDIISRLAEHLSQYGVKEGFINAIFLPPDELNRVTKWYVIYAEYRDKNGNPIRPRAPNLYPDMYYFMYVVGLKDGYLYPDNPENYWVVNEYLLWATARDGQGEEATNYFDGIRLGDVIDFTYPGFRVTERA